MTSRANDCRANDCRANDCRANDCRANDCRANDCRANDRRANDRLSNDRLSNDLEAKFRYLHPQTDGEEDVLPYGHEASNFYCVFHNTFFIEEFNTVHFFLYFSVFSTNSYERNAKLYLGRVLRLGYSSINSQKISI